MADNQELFETIISGLSNLKQIQDGLIDELNGFQDVYSKDYKQVNDRLDNIAVQIDSTIKEALANIPEGITEEQILKLISDNKQDINLDELKQEIQSFIDAIPKAKDGTNGIDGVDGKNGLNGTDGIDGADGKDGTNGERGLSGQQGQKGSDGVGVEDIKRDNEDLLVILTDGTEKRIRLPKQQTKYLGGGGGLTLQEATSALIVNINADTNIEALSQSILVNASSGEVNLTLPNPEGCLIRGRSYAIGITKIEHSTNVVNILPNGSELISGETSQVLTAAHDVLNFITDGTNWYLQN